MRGKQSGLFESGWIESGSPQSSGLSPLGESGLDGWRQSSPDRIASGNTPQSRGWKFDQGWLLRTRSRTGAEGKQKCTTYREAADAGRVARATGQYRECWVEEVGFVPRAWRDLDADRQQRQPDDRAHVLNVEEDGE
jgi:hypothetical protein